MTAREGDLTPNVERTADGRHRPLVGGEPVPGDPACETEAEARAYAQQWADYWAGLRRVLRRRRQQ